MRLLLCFLLPPLAVLLCGKPIQAVLCLVLTLLLWVPGVIYALMVLSGHNADKRTNRIVRELKRAR